MSGELPGHGPNDGVPLVLREARQVVGDENERHISERIRTVYSKLRDTLALAGITPERAPYFDEKHRTRPARFHFMDLPGKFFIGFLPNDKKNLFLTIIRMQDLETGGYIRETFNINLDTPASISYKRLEYDSSDKPIAVNKVGQSGYIALDTPSTRRLAVEKIEALTDALHETITRDEHHPANIQQEAIALYARLKRILPMRQLRRRKTSKEINLPGLGPVEVRVYGREIHILRTVPMSRENYHLAFYEDGNAEAINITTYPHIEYGHVKAGSDGFDLHNPHFVLMEIRELEQAISS